MIRRRFAYELGKVDDINNYLTVMALEDGLSVWYSLDCYYAIDGGFWNYLSAEENTPEIKAGQTISFKNEINEGSCGYFQIYKECNLLGNVLSIAFGDNAKFQYDITGISFVTMFENCWIVEVSKNFLPATTLSESCYGNMFMDCGRLVQAPELPATTLSDYCYESMFRNCKSLTQAPELPATTLSDYCYYYMFDGCYNLTTAPSILPATTLASNCYNGMFSYCTSLTTAPELPATTLASNCYFYMFYGCSKLNYIKAMFTTEPSNSYTSYWVNGVASTGRFVKNKNATWNVTGVNGIPSGWSIQSAAQ